MRLTKIGIATLAAAGLLLAGCGSDDTADPETSGGSADAADPQESTSQDTSEEPDDSDDEGTGEASDDLISWAGEFCGAIAPLQDQISGDGMGELASADPSDPAAIIEQIQETFSGMGPLFAEARDAVESAGAPPIDDGDAVYQNMLDVLGTSADAFAEMDDELAALDPNDPAALQSLTPLFTEIGEELGSAGQDIDAAFSQPDMEAAFAAAPECEGVDVS